MAGSWDECIESGNALNVSSDVAKARSLIETAKGRIAFLEDNTLNERNASFVFEGYYSSLLEILHVLVILTGFKVVNHICLGFYLRDAIGRDDLFRVFDDCRIKRNALVYQGKMMDLETARAMIGKTKNLINESESIFAQKNTDM